MKKKRKIREAVKKTIVKTLTKRKGSVLSSGLVVRQKKTSVHVKKRNQSAYLHLNFSDVVVFFSL